MADNVIMSRRIRMCSVIIIGLLAGCGDRPWNYPYGFDLPEKNLFFGSFSERPKHLDPAVSYSASEVVFTGQIYEPPLQYHYLKRPYELETLTAEVLPQPIWYDSAGDLLDSHASPDQVMKSVYRIKIKPGIYYQPHPALAKDSSGNFLYHQLTDDELKDIYAIADFEVTGSRELVAADYVHQIKRLAHPKLHSPILGLMSAYIEGLAELSEELNTKHEQGEQIDLTQIQLSGVRELDRYTYEITIKGKYPQFAYWLAMPFFAPMPPEADRFYDQPGLTEKNVSLDWYPIGTGPFMLVENNPNRRMVMVRNPNYRTDDFYPAEGLPEDKENGLLQDAGKPMPFIEQAIYSREVEAIPTWNKFLQGYYDTSGVSSESFDQVVQFGSTGDAVLTEEIQQKGIRLVTSVAATSFYTGFNMLDPVIGGYSEEAKKLRRAVSIAMDYEEYISIFRNGRGIPSHGPIPPGIFGYLPERLGINSFVYRWQHGEAVRQPVAEAKRLLAEAGYPGGRSRKTGEPLILYFDVTATGPDAKAWLDWLRKQFQKIDI
ncbi:MAG TPA: peptide ABC transporter substrate-binding protein, partial [Gammaproteobacteria bacterium]|nr:peptide ABC transporter substrate-binding protein [Gammaproteobacteria bacterium]